MNRFEPEPSNLPFAWINLVDECLARVVTVAWPTELVQGLLPYGTVLGPQDLTPPGTHPVILLFYEIFRLHMTIPAILPNMTYREHIVGVPYVMVQNGDGWKRDAGPFFFMPRLLLSNFWATLGGVLYWGYAKRVADISLTEDCFAVKNLAGAPLVSLDFAAYSTPQPIEQFPYFAPIRACLDQPLLTQMPLGEGPVIVCTRYDRQWSTAALRPMSGAVTIEQAYLPGLPCGRFPGNGFSVGIDESSLGSFELLAHCRQSLPYPWSMHRRLQNRS